MNLGPNPVREMALKQRKSLSANEVKAFSEDVIIRFLSRVKSQEDQLRGIHVGMYRALPFELTLDFIEPFLRGLGCKIYFPRVVKKSSRELEFVEVPAGKEDPVLWQKGHYGIQEPHEDLQPISAPEKLDLIFVPGVAFGESGERIGMGAGFYDRYLCRASQALRLALVFDFQLFQKLEQNPWDQPVHWIVTEKREWRGPFAEARFGSFRECWSRSIKVNEESF